MQFECRPHSLTDGLFTVKQRIPAFAHLMSRRLRLQPPQPNIQGLAVMQALSIYGL